MTSVHGQNTFQHGQMKQERPPTSISSKRSDDTAPVLRNALTTELYEQNFDMLNGIGTAPICSAVQTEDTHIDACFASDLFPEGAGVHLEQWCTPEYSSENPQSDLSSYTSPAAADSIHGTTSYLDLLGPAGGSGEDISNLGAYLLSQDSRLSEAGLQQIVLSSPPNGQLASPQLTTPSPPMVAHKRLMPRSSAAVQSITSAPATTSSPRPILKPLALDPSSLAVPAHLITDGATGHQSVDLSTRAVSPVVTVSMHTRGDSPVRPILPLKRHSSNKGFGNFLVPAQVDSSLVTEDLSTSSQDPPVNHGVAHDRADSDPRDRAGLNPDERGDQLVPSLQDIQERRKVHIRNAEVESWLAASENGSDLDAESILTGETKLHPRYNNTEIPNGHQPTAKVGHNYIPGPGVLLDVESDENELPDDLSAISHSRSPSPVSGGEDYMEARHLELWTSPLPELGTEEPLPRQFYRRAPWQDLVQFPGQLDCQEQPASSNAAMYAFEQQAAKLETASRAATWGTRRRMSDSEIEGIVKGNRLRNMSLQHFLTKRTIARAGSLRNKFRPNRSLSHSKNRTPPNATPTRVESHATGASSGSQTPLDRISSVRKSKSPSRSGGNPFRAVANHLSSSGRGASLTSEVKTSGGPWLKRNRSKSEFSRSNNKGKLQSGLVELITHNGGPPMPTLGCPLQEPHNSKVSIPHYPSKHDEDVEEYEDEDEDEMLSDTGIRMDLKVQVANITPSFEGFRTHAYELNPRLEPFLLERIAQEQVRRYKKLLEYKIKHAQAVHIYGRCPSGKYCFELGGSAIILPPRPSGKDTDTKIAQFQVRKGEDTEEDEDTTTEGVVTPALFPPGIPLPPVKRLPAEFECPLCFKVKIFHKPSDWTKHVHEDVQPFSCTFTHCPDPKSFKRKADWVRHENERHRHLEWWQCNIGDCIHVCYRKDNFVQHLVREHKLPEPRAKIRGSGSSKHRAPGAVWQPGEEVSQELELRHFDTDSKPTAEMCKFCGNKCSTWKKVSSHLGKHMEQIALPVLQLVMQREVSPDTVISPVETGYHLQGPHEFNQTDVAAEQDYHSLSPYPASAASLPHSSSAGQSPVIRNSYALPDHFHYAASLGRASASDHQPSHYAGVPIFGGATQSYPSQAGYGTYGGMQPQQFVPMGHATYPPPQTYVSRSPIPSLIPRSQPAVHLNTNSAAVYQMQDSQAMYSSPIDTQQYMNVRTMDPSQPSHHATAHMGNPGAPGPRTPSNANGTIYDVHDMTNFHTEQQTHGHNAYRY